MHIPTGGLSADNNLSSPCEVFMIAATAVQDSASQFSSSKTHCNIIDCSNCTQASFVKQQQIKRRKIKIRKREYAKQNFNLYFGRSNLLPACLPAFKRNTNLKAKHIPRRGIRQCGVVICYVEKREKTKSASQQQQNSTSSPKM